MINDGVTTLVQGLGLNYRTKTANITNITKVTVQQHTTIRSMCSRIEQEHITHTYCLQNMQSLKSRSISLSNLTTSFQGKPWLACFNGAKDNGSGGDNWSYKMLQSNRHHQQTST